MQVVVGGSCVPARIESPDIDLGITAFTNGQECLRFAMEQGVDASASPCGVWKGHQAVREAAKEFGHNPFIIAKIERSRALDRFQEILDSADGIMIAVATSRRSPIEKIALIQKDLMRKANMRESRHHATQMLESMTRTAAPHGPRRRTWPMRFWTVRRRDALGESAMGITP